MTNTKSRFWHHSKAVLVDGVWKADLPLHSTDKPLWVYANVLYPLKEKVSGAGYYYGSYTAKAFNLSSKMTMIMPNELQAAKVKPSLQPQLLIENFNKDWEKEWFTYKAHEWPLKTHKMYSPVWQAPETAKLSLKVLSSEVNKLVIGIDEYAAEINLKGKNQWQQLLLSPDDFKNASGKLLTSFQNIKEFRLGHLETLRDRKKNLAVKVGAKWKGNKPQFQDLKWVP